MSNEWLNRSGGRRGIDGQCRRDTAEAIGNEREMWIVCPSRSNWTAIDGAVKNVETRTGRNYIAQKNALEGRGAAYAATNVGLAYLQYGFRGAPRKKTEIVMLEREQFDALLHRIDVLEAKSGMKAELEQLSRGMTLEVISVTQELFEASPSIETTNGEDPHFRVAVRVSNADPQDISSRRSRWHDAIMTLDIPKAIRDKLRLKVIYG